MIKMKKVPRQLAGNCRNQTRYYSQYYSAGRAGTCPVVLSVPSNLNFLGLTLMPALRNCYYKPELVLEGDVPVQHDSVTGHLPDGDCQGPGLALVRQQGPAVLSQAGKVDRNWNNRDNILCQEQKPNTIQQNKTKKDPQEHSIYDFMT